jgi:protocatechuate 3,4-dioxygenase beta subunit
MTPKMHPDNQPEFFPTYNDLNRKEGDFDSEYADSIMIRGIVADKNCVPISDVSINIWQEDEYGTVRYVPDDYFPYKGHNMNYKMHRDIQGLGRTYSTNEGRFKFITVPPGGMLIKNHKQKYINISISHPDLPGFEGKLILNEGDIPISFKKSKFILAQINEDASTCHGMDVFDFDIVLDHVNKYRRH